MTVRIAEDVIFRMLGEEAVILNLKTGVYFGLDEIGTRYWQLITEHGSPEKAVETMLGEYDVEASRLGTDVDELTQQLVDRGLVTVEV